MNGTWNNCPTIPPEPNIFKPGFLPDILDKYVIKERLEDYSYIQRTQIVYQGRIARLISTAVQNELPSD